MNDPYLDQVIHRLQNLPPFHIYALDANGGLVEWMDVPVQHCVQELSVRRDTLPLQVESIASQVGHWGRLSALTKRAWETREREYRIWRDQTLLEIMKPPAPGEEKEGWGETAKKDPKAPSQAAAEQLMRQRPEYVDLNRRVEEAEEAHNATLAFLEAFRVKANVLRHFVRVDQMTGQPTLSV